MLDRGALMDQLVIDEGVRLKAYRDTVGKVTIGIGRNLTDVGITRPEAFYLAYNDIDRLLPTLTAAIGGMWNDLSEPRQRVLMNMAFNLGVGGVLKFKNTLQLIAQGRFDEAADAMLASKWAQQVGARADRLAEVMRNG